MKRNQKFGDCLRKLRKATNYPLPNGSPLTQKEVVDLLAKVSDLTYSGSTISDWERGKNAPPERFVVLKLIQVLHEHKGIQTVAEANELLEAGDHYALTRTEKKTLGLEVINLAPQQLRKLYGRETILKQIKKRLSTGQRVALYGLPGVGKTSLATTIAHNKAILSDFPDGVLWLGLGSKPNLLGELINLGKVLHISTDELGQQTNPRQCARLISQVIGDSRRLIVIDDVWEAQILGFLQEISGENCATLLTTRFAPLAHQFVSNSLYVFSIPELDVETGVTLLTSITPHAVQREPKTSRTLIEAVGGLPLGIVLMGSYLQAHRHKPHYLSWLLDALQTAQERLALSQVPEDIHHYPSLSSDVPLSLYAMISLSYEALPKKAQHMLRAAAVLPPKPNTFSHETAVTLADAHPATLITLESYSLLEEAGVGRYQLHQVIADYGRLQNPTEQARFHKKAAVYFAQLAYQNRTHEKYHLLEVDHTNIITALRWAAVYQQHEALQQGVNALTQTWFGLLGYMDSSGHWRQAQELLENAYQVAQKHADMPVQIALLAKMGAFTLRQANHELAEQQLHTAYQQHQTLSPHADVILEYSHLYEFLFRLDEHRDIEAAFTWLEEGLTALADNTTPEAIHQTGYFHILRCTLEGRSGQLERAYETVQMGLTLLPDTPTPARLSGLISLSTILGMMGKKEESHEQLKTAVSLAITLKDYKRLTKVYINLSINLRKLGNFSQASDYAQKALQIQEAHFGRLDQREISNLHIRLGTLYGLLGEDTLAQQYLQTAINIGQTYQLRDVMAFAQVEIVQLNLYQLDILPLADMAQPTHQTTLNNAKMQLTQAGATLNELGYARPRPSTLYLLAEVARLRGDLDQALTSINDALRAFQPLKKANPSIAWSIKGKILDAQGLFEAADIAHQTSLNHLKTHEPYELARGQLMTARHYIQWQQPHKAKPLLQKALTTFQKLGTKREATYTQTLLNQLNI